MLLFGGLSYLGSNAVDTAVPDASKFVTSDLYVLKVLFGGDSTNLSLAACPYASSSACRSLSNATRALGTVPALAPINSREGEVVHSAGRSFCTNLGRWAVVWAVRRLQCFLLVCALPQPHNQTPATSGRTRRAAATATPRSPSS